MLSIRKKRIEKGWSLTRVSGLTGSQHLISRKWSGSSNPLFRVRSEGWRELSGCRPGSYSGSQNEHFPNP